MLRTLTPEETRESNRRAFALAEAGFLLKQDLERPEDTYKLIIEKDERNQRLAVVPLSQENLFKMCAGEKVGPLEYVGLDEIHHVIPTAVTDTMCREREGLAAYCRTCGHTVSRRDDRRDYVVDADGLCRHARCQA